MGDLTWPIIRDRVDAAVTVFEVEIVAAMRLVFERMKVFVVAAPRAGLWKPPAQLCVCPLVASDCEGATLIVKPQRPGVKLPLVGVIMLRLAGCSNMLPHAARG